MMSNFHFEFIRHDVTEPIYVECDQIYNLVCPVSPPHYQFDPVQFRRWSDEKGTGLYGVLFLEWMMGDGSYGRFKKFRLPETAGEKIIVNGIPWAVKSGGWDP